jgi:hypothetical protein
MSNIGEIDRRGGLNRGGMDFNFGRGENGF